MIKTVQNVFSHFVLTGLILFENLKNKFMSL